MRPGRRSSQETRFLLVSSNGGHLLELRELADGFAPHTRHWVSFDAPDTRSLLEGESVTYAYQPTNRHLGNLVRNFLLALRTVARLRPEAVISTGAGVAVPFLYAGRLFGARAIYVESLARIEQLSLSGRMVAPIVTELFVQWPELEASHPRARYVGAII